MAPKQGGNPNTVSKQPSRKAKEGNDAPGNYSRASQPAATRNTQVQQPNYPIGGIANAVATGQKVTELQKPAAGRSSGTTTTTQPKQNNKSKSGAKGTDANIDAESPEGSSGEEQGPVKQRDRSKSARQTILEGKPRYFIVEQGKKIRRDRTADLQAAAEVAAELLDSSDENDEDESEDEDDDEVNKDDENCMKGGEHGKEDGEEDEDDDDEKSDNNGGTLTSKGSDPKKKSTAEPTKGAAKSSARSTIVKGNITKAVKAKPESQAKRRHVENVYDYESAPDLSDLEGVNKSTFSRLWDSVNRHARWCPFVRINKKLQNAHRRIKMLESPPSDSSGDDNEDDQETSKAKSKAKAKKPIPQAKRPAPKKPVPKSLATKTTKTIRTPKADQTNDETIRLDSKTQHFGAEDAADREFESDSAARRNKDQTPTGNADQEDSSKIKTATVQSNTGSTAVPTSRKRSTEFQGEILSGDESAINPNTSVADDNDNPANSDDELSSPPATSSQEALAAYAREISLTNNGEAAMHVPSHVLQSGCMKGAVGQKRKASTAEPATHSSATKKEKRKSVTFQVY